MSLNFDSYKREKNIKAILVAILIGTLAISTGYTIQSSAISSSNVATYNQFGTVIPCTYEIFQIESGTTRTIDAKDCDTGQIAYSNTDASTILTNVFTQINTKGGGAVYVKGYGISHPYNMSTGVALPTSGNLKMWGDGPQMTVFKVTPGTDNIDMFYFVGSQSADVFFWTFRDFQLYGNPSGTNNTGFYLGSTSHGLKDDIWQNVFIEQFGYDGVYMSSVNLWDTRFVDDIFEYNYHYAIETAGGSDLRIQDTKFLFNQGAYALYLIGGDDSVVNCFFYQNQKTGILAAASGSTIMNNKFQDDGQAATNTYYDISTSGLKSSSIVGNIFQGGDTSNKPKAGIFISDATSTGNTISGNDFGAVAGSSWGTSAIVGFHNAGTNFIVNNGSYNPLNKVTNFVDNSGAYFVSVGGTTGTIVNGTTYTISDSPAFITVSGGTGVSITIQDGSSNNIQTGLTTLTEQYFPVGYKVKVTWSSIPTVTVFFT